MDFTAILLFFASPPISTITDVYGNHILDMDARFGFANAIIAPVMVP